MGYRSNGAIRITGPKDRLIAEMGALVLLEGEEVRKALKEFVLNADGDNDAVLGLSYEGWKWYSDFSDVQAFEKIWTHFSNVEDDETDTVFRGAFIRLGEVDDDTEQRMFGEEAWELIQLRRSFECEHDLDPTKDLRNNRSSSNEQKTEPA